MRRADAFALVRERGGTPRDGVTKDTQVLIVGELGWPLLDDGRASNSLARARSYGVPIVSERRFLEWVGRAVSEDQAKTYTGDQLSALSKLPKVVVEQLAMFGLIEARRELYGFRDLAAARQIAGLLAAGTTLSVITRSLHDIRQWLPDARLSNVRLFPEASDKVLVEQLQGRTDKKGQFVLDVGQPADNLDDLFELAQAAEEAGDLVSAERLYRRVAQTDPADTASAFNLGNVLRSSGRNVEAESVYRAVIRIDPDFAAAWYNLADLLDEQGRAMDAVACLERAVKADSQFADAMFNLALFLQRLERQAEAAAWWRRYLALDSSSPSAARARRALKICEIQIAGSSS